MKAIETEYKGYKFRSRLEARWAVFFDACGVKWEYEPEGYDLGNGIYYLPDFLLHNVYLHNDYGYYDFNDIFVEVKANISVEDAEKILRFYELGRTPSNVWDVSKTAILVVGKIHEGNDIKKLFANLSAISHTNYFGVRFYHFYTIDGTLFCAFPCVNVKGNFLLLDELSFHRNEYARVAEYKTTQAYRLARQSRFEHGETPQIHYRNHNELPSITNSLLKFIKCEYHWRIRNGEHLLTDSAKKLAMLEKECGTQNVIEAIERENLHYPDGVEDFLFHDSDEGTFCYICRFARGEDDD